MLIGTKLQDNAPQCSCDDDALNPTGIDTAELLAGQQRDGSNGTGNSEQRPTRKHIQSVAL